LFHAFTVFAIPGGNLTDDDVAPVAVVAAVASLLLLALAVLAAICCLQRRRRRLLGNEPEKAASAVAASGKLHAAAGLPVYRNKDDRKVAANNKMEDLLQHNTQQLLQPVNSNLYVESLQGNEYEVPSSGGERSCYGYYDLRGTVRPSAALR
jgi:hypothetical protein